MKLVIAAIFAAGVLPYLFVLFSKAGAMRGRDNFAVRDWQDKLTGWRKRSHWASQNGFEVFPFFAVGALISAHHQHAVLLSWSFVGLRLVYGALYIADKAALRSLVWFAGMAAAGALYALSLI